MEAFKPLFRPTNPDSQYDFNVYPQPSSQSSANYANKESMAFFFNSNTSKYPSEPSPFNHRKHQLQDDTVDSPPAVKKYLSEKEMSAHFSSMNINLYKMNASQPARMEPLYIDSSPPSKLEIEEVDDDGNPICQFEHMEDETLPSYSDGLANFGAKAEFSKELKQHLSRNFDSAVDKVIRKLINRHSCTDIVLYKPPKDDLFLNEESDEENPPKKKNFIPMSGELMLDDGLMH